MSSLRRSFRSTSRQAKQNSMAFRRAQRGRNLRFEPLEQRTVFSVTSPITTVGAATMLTTDLPPTSQTGAVNGQDVSYGANYATPFAPQPNVTANFTASGLPVQSSDWWSSIMFRTLNATSPDSGYALSPNVDIDAKSQTFTTVTANNLSYPLYADPLVLQVDNSSSVSGNLTTFSPRGLAIGYASSYGNSSVPFPGQVTDSIITANYNQDLLVGLVDSSTGTRISSANIAVDNYSDWGATFSWSNGLTGTNAASITATAANGSPYVYFTTAGGTQVQIDVTGQSAGPSLLYLSGNGRVAVVLVPNGPEGVVNANNVYALFAPVGGSWVYTPAGSSTPAMLTMQLTGANATASYFSAAILPNEYLSLDSTAQSALVETYRQHAYAFILGPAATRAGVTATTPGTQVIDYDYVATTSSVVTTLGVTTQLMDTTDTTLVNGALLALYPHQAKNLVDNNTIDPLTAGLNEQQFTFNSGKGTMRLFASTNTSRAALFTTEFTTSMYYQGVVPYLPNALTSADTATRDQLIAYIHDVATGAADVRGFPFPGISENLNFISTDTNYTAGKHFLRVSLLLPIIDQLLEITSSPTNLAQLTADRLTLLGQVKTALSSFFDVGGYQWLAYNDAWDTVIPYPDDNGTATNMNDKHFKWGYFLRAAALIARYDADFISPDNYGPILELIARDAANWDRTTTGQFELPFLRNFNPYAGHSWANGDAIAGDGNNQESSGEAINFAVGLIQLGEAYMAFDATTGAKIREMGIYLFTTETEAIAQYYYNVDQDNFPDNYTLNYATVSTQSSITATATTVNVSGSSFPLGFPQGTGDTYRIRIDNETMLVTGRTLNALTVIRGYDGSVPQSHAASVGLSLLDPLTSLASAITSISDTTMTVASAAGFPPAPAGGATQFQFNVRIDDEIITVTGGAGTNTWTILRGQNGTAPALHSAAASVILQSQVAPWGNLSGAANATTTSITYTASPQMAAFPNPATRPFQIEIDGERMLVTAAPSANTLTVIRGYAGTTATAHAAGAKFELITRQSSWVPPDTTLTGPIGTTDSALDIDTGSATFGGFGEIADVIETATVQGQLLSFSTTLAQAISDASSVIDIYVDSVPAAISTGAMFFVRIGTGPTQSTYFVQNVLNAPFTEWNVVRVGTFHAQAAGAPVELVWLSGTTSGDPSLQPTLILDPSTLPTITSSFAPFPAYIGADSYTVAGTSGTYNNIWTIGAALANDYAASATVNTGISSSSDVIALESTAGFPTTGSFRILVDNEIMLVQGVYYDQQLNQFIPNMWSVIRGYDGTTAVAHSGDATIMLVDPENSFTVQVGDERMLVLGKTDADTWAVLRGADGTTATSQVSGATVSLVGIPPLTLVDITGRLYGSGPQKAIFFSTPAMDREASIRMIQTLPISGASLYLGQFRNADGSSTMDSEARMLAAFEQFLINAQVYPGEVGAGGVYPGTIWGLQALADPTSALANFNAFIANNYGYNIVVGTLAAEPVSSGDSSVLVAPSNGVFPIPPDGTPILTYFKVGFGDGTSDTLLVNQMQLNADVFGNTQLSGTRNGGASQPFGEKVIPVAFTTQELGDVVLAQDLDWGVSTVYIKDTGNNPFPSVAPLNTAENVRFYVQVQFQVNTVTVTENWLVTSQTRTSSTERTWTVEREIVPLSEAINQANTKLLTGTAITPVSAFFKFNANSGLDEGESAANTFNFINQLGKLGTPDPGVVAIGASSFAVFKNASGQRTYTVYNNSDSILPTVSFYEIEPDGQLGATPLFTFTNVLARSYFQYSEATTQETIESIPYIDVTGADNQFYLLNTQGNNPSNLPNAMSSGDATSPGGSGTSLLDLPQNGTGNATFTGGTSFIVNNVSGQYNSSAGNTKFQLFTVNGSTQSYSTSNPELLDSLTAALPTSAAYTTIVRVSYYAGANATGTPFRVELFNDSSHNDPDASSTDNTYDTYTDGVGIKTATGAYQDMNGGSIKVEVWLWDLNGGSGTQDVSLKVGTPLELDPQASRIEIPFTNVSVTGPGITGTVAGQAISDHMIVLPFSGVTITNPTPAQVLDVTVEIVTPGDGSFTEASMLYSGFVEQTPGSGEYTFQGTAAEATAAIQQLQFRATRSEGTVGSTRTIPFRITVEQPGGESVTDNTTTVLATNTAASNSGYVESLYVELFGRNPDTNGLAHWVGLLNGGASRESVYDALYASQEHREFQVENYYHRYLGRPSDAWGKPQWVALLMNGAPEEAVIASFLSSAEFEAEHPTNSDIVDGLYEDLLGRAPDNFGYPRWMNLLDTGTSVYDVVRQFLVSNEYLGLKIDGYFNDWLGRQPTQFERALFINQAISAGSLASVTKLILLSDEFWNES